MQLEGGRSLAWAGSAVEGEGRTWHNHQDDADMTS